MNRLDQRRFLTATGYSLLEFARNRLAIALLIVFVPVWEAINAAIIASKPQQFLFHASNTMISVNGRQLVLLTAGFNAITLIAGFTIFSATRKGTPFDRRLIQSGYPQRVLVLARLAALTVVALVISAYATLVLLAFWRPSEILTIWLAFALASLIYSVLGFLLGVVLRGELEGFFLIIMISLVDTFLQNVPGSPNTAKSVVPWLPSYGSMQISVAGGFHRAFPWMAFAAGIAWLVIPALLALALFVWKTRALGSRAGAARGVPAIARANGAGSA